MTRYRVTCGGIVLGYFKTREAAEADCRAAETSYPPCKPEDHEIAEVDE